MTLSQIQCFLMVVEKMNFTEAARALYVSQPAVSRRVALLEEEMGIQLFYRENSKLTLTPAGAEFVQFFKSFVNGLDELIRNSKKEMSTLQGKVVIGCADGWDLTEILNWTKAVLAEDYPALTIKLKYLDHECLIDKLSKGELDIAIDQEELFAGMAEITTFPVRKVPYVLMYAATHPLAGKKNPDLSDFKDCLFRQRSSETCKNISETDLKLCQQAGFMPKVEQVDSLAAAMANLLSEKSVFIADEKLINLSNPLFSYFTLPENRTISLASNIRKKRSVSIVETILVSCCEELYGSVS